MRGDDVVTTAPWTAMDTTGEYVIENWVPRPYWQDMGPLVLIAAAVVGGLFLLGRMTR